MPAHRLLGISGSLRAASTNTKLIHAAKDIFDPAEFTMGSIDLPLYSGDVEEGGIPASVQALSDQIKAVDARIQQAPLRVAQERAGLGEPHRRRAMEGQARRGDVCGRRSRGW